MGAGEQPLGTPVPSTKPARWRAVATAVGVGCAWMLGAPADGSAQPNAASSPEAAPRVLVVARSARDPMVERMRDELALLGIEVRQKIVARGREQLAALAAAEHASAVIWVEPWPPEIVLWVDPTAEQEPYGPPSELRVSDSLFGEPRPDLLVLRAVELLRGRLLRVEPRTAPTTVDTPTVAPAPSTAPSTAPLPAPAPSPPASPPPTAAPSAEAPRPAGAPTTEDALAARPGAPRAWLGLSPGLAFSPGGVPASFQVRAGAGFELGHRLGLEAMAWIPTVETAVSEPEGEVGLRTLLVAGLLAVRLTPDDEDSWGAMVGAGMGATALWYDAAPTPPYQGRSGAEWGAAPCLELAGRYRILEWLGLRADAAVALSLPEAVLRVAGRESASWGLPVVMIGFGVEALP